MTKLEMVTEIMQQCKWSASSMENNIKRAIRLNTVADIKRIYTFYKAHPDKHRFCAELLAH